MRPASAYAPSIFSERGRSQEKTEAGFKPAHPRPPTPPAPHSLNLNQAYEDPLARHLPTARPFCAPSTHPLSSSVFSLVYERFEAFNSRHSFFAPGHCESLCLAAPLQFFSRLPCVLHRAYRRMACLGIAMCNSLVRRLYDECPRKPTVDNTCMRGSQWRCFGGQLAWHLETDWRLHAWCYSRTTTSR